MKHGGSVHSYVNVYQRVHGIQCIGFWLVVVVSTPLKNDGLRQLGSCNSN